MDLGSFEDMTPGQLQSLFSVTKAMLDNPQTRRAYLENVKKINPNVSIPELDAAEPLHHALAEERKARERLEASIEEERNNRKEEQIRKNLEESRDSVKKKYKFNDEQLASVEKWMVDEQVNNYEVAAKFFRMQNQAADTQAATRPYEIQSNTYEFPQAWKGINANSGRDIAKISKQEAFRTLNDMRKQAV